MAMDPKELRKRFEAKSAETAAKSAHKKAQLAAEKAEQAKREEEARTALRDVVIPYFNEIKAEFPKGQFSFDHAVSMTLSPVRVSFKVGNGPRYFLEVIGGNVRILKEGPSFAPPKGPQSGRKAPPGTNVQFVFSPNSEPFIKEPSDLTRENLGRLVQMAIDETE